MKKYRIKESEELVTRYKGGQFASEGIEKAYQIEYRLSGFWGKLWGWEEIGSQFFTEPEAREKVEYYKRLDKGPRFGKREVTYIETD
jgi:hypothetical protein